MKINDVDRCLGCMQDKADQPICPHCGFDEATEINPAPCLALGMVLNDQYILGRMLGHGGFGITYLAWDTRLETAVAIKEYWPREYGQRATDGITFSCYPGEAAEFFAYGLERFIEEARNLARFGEHPGIVSVYNQFEINGLAYMVMQYIEGIDLKSYITRQGGRIPIESALHLMTPVLDGLRAMHEQNLLHRDISPDNIYITANGRVILLDFGATKDSLSSHSQSQLTIRKPGYSPEEQYSFSGKQGTWTDVYAAAATIYRLITGFPPPDAMDRLREDQIQRPSKTGVVISIPQETALMKALAVRSSERFQSIAEFQQALDIKPFNKPPDDTSKNWWRKFAISNLIITFILVIIGIYLLLHTLQQNTDITDMQQRLDRANTQTQALDNSKRQIKRLQSQLKAYQNGRPVPPRSEIRTRPKYLYVVYNGINGVRVRSYAGGQVIATALKQKVVPIKNLSTTPKIKNNLHWINVEINGWMARRKLDKLQPYLIEMDAINSKVIWDGGGTANFVSLRSGPSTSNTRIAKVYTGSYVNTGTNGGIRQIKIDGEFEWIKVTLIGWMALRSRNGEPLLQK